MDCEECGMLSDEAEPRKNLSASPTSYAENSSPSSSPVYVDVTPVVLTIVLGAMIAVTVVGNVLVCLSVVLVRKLRHPSNYLLVSLAVSDLCVAVLVMPLALHYELQGAWNLGVTICNMWVAFDVTSCTASILNLCMISIDRYLAITKPLTYGVKRTAKRMSLCIAAVWMLSCLISVPPLLILGNEHGTPQEPSCEVSRNVGYQLYATLGSFYIPLVVMIVMYYKIYVAAKTVVEAEHRAQTHSKKQIEAGMAAMGDRYKWHVWVRLDRGGSVATEESTVNHTFATNGDTSSGAEVSQAESTGAGNRMSFVSNSISAQSSPQHAAVCAYESRPLPPNKRLASVLKERKASVTLGVIMTAFTVCWLPFFIMALLRPFSTTIADLPRVVNSFVLWLGYVNSMLNPVIYVTFHHDFRKSFKYLLCLQCSTMSTKMREEAYHSQYGVRKSSSNARIAASRLSLGGGIATTAAEQHRRTSPPRHAVTATSGGLREARERAENGAGSIVLEKIDLGESVL